MTPAERPEEAPEDPLVAPGRPDFVLVDDPGDIDLLADSLSADPIALDVERASGYRYPDRAFLVQLREREGAARLVDPEGQNRSLGRLAGALSERTLILHAANQDLPSLRALGVHPTALIDTELAGRFLGLPKVNLGSMVAEFLGIHLSKAHSAADWSSRPLPEEWLEYAAYDVLWLHELADITLTRIEEAGLMEWYAAECRHLVTAPPPPPAVDPWRRLSQVTSLRSPRLLARARELWHAREQAAIDLDVAPKRILSDAAVIAAAQQRPTDTRTLLAIDGFSGPIRRPLAGRWLAALQRADDLEKEALPQLRGPRGAHPPHASWKRLEPRAAALLALARAALADLSEEIGIGHELLLRPSTMRLWVWRAVSGSGVDDEQLMDTVLREEGARDWQIEVAGPQLLGALHALRQACRTPAHARMRSASAGAVIPYFSRISPRDA